MTSVFQDRRCEVVRFTIQSPISSSVLKETMYNVDDDTSVSIVILDVSVLKIWANKIPYYKLGKVNKIKIQAKSFTCIFNYNKQNKGRTHILYSYPKLSLNSVFLPLTSFYHSPTHACMHICKHTHVHMHTHRIGLVYFKTLLTNPERNSFNSATTFEQMELLYNQIWSALCTEIRFYSVFRHLTIQIVCKPNLIKSKDIYSMLCSFMQKYYQLFKKPYKMLPQVFPRTYHGKHCSYIFF